MMFRCLFHALFSSFFLKIKSERTAFCPRGNAAVGALLPLRGNTGFGFGYCETASGLRRRFAIRLRGCAVARRAGQYAQLSGQARIGLAQIPNIQTNKRVLFRSKPHNPPSRKQTADRRRATRAIKIRFTCRLLNFMRFICVQNANDPTKP